MVSANAAFYCSTLSRNLYYCSRYSLKNNLISRTYLSVTIAMDQCDYSTQVSLDSGIYCDSMDYPLENNECLKKVNRIERQESNDNDNQSVPDFDKVLKDIGLSLDAMLSNKYEEAFRLCDPWSKTHLYYAMQKSLLYFFQAMLTLEKEQISQAITFIERTLSICAENRRSASFSESITSWIWDVDYNSWTDDEVNAELCYAELQTMITLLTFFETQSLISLIKGAFRLRASYNAYKHSEKILSSRTEWHSKKSRDEFESGVRMGVGITNLVLSHLPSKILKLLSIVGFSGDFKVAMEQLRACLTFKHCVRYRICAFMVISYNLYWEQMIGVGESNIEWAQQLTEELTRKFPNAALLMFFVGRLQQLSGNPEQAIATFSKCISLQDQWKQVHNICYWDMTWCYALLGDWQNAEKCADILTEQCDWLPSINAYQSAIFKCMRSRNDTSFGLRQEIYEKMRSVEGLRKRYAGKSYPPEKLAITRSQQYINGVVTPLPAFEFFYVWNIYSLCSGKAALIEPIIKQIEDELQKDAVTKENHAMLLLLKGVCLRNLNRNEEAIECLQNVFLWEKHLSDKSYIPAHTALELGLIFIKLRKTENARYWLQTAKKGYKKYLIEALVHLKVHSANKMLQKLENGEL